MNNYTSKLIALPNSLTAIILGIAISIILVGVVHYTLDKKKRDRNKKLGITDENTDV